MRFTVLFAFIALFLTSSFALSQTDNSTTNEWEDIILLKSGASFRGIIFEQIPNKYYKIRLNDGTVLEFESFLVDVVTRQPKVKFPAQQQQTGASPSEPTITTPSDYRIVAPHDDRLPSTWLTFGPSVNLGYIVGASSDAYTSTLSLFYGLNLHASYGKKLSEKMYIWGTLSGDFNKVVTSYSSGSGSSYTQTSGVNQYRIGLGMSYKVIENFIVWSIGESFAEKWIPERKIDNVVISPAMYASDRFLYVNWGAVIPLDFHVSGYITADITYLFEEVHLGGKFGLLYTPNF